MTEEPPSADNVVHFPARQPYNAFHDAGCLVPRLSLQANGAHISVPYHMVSLIEFDADAGAISFYIDDRFHVRIPGQHLAPVYDSLHMQQCLWIQAYDDEAFHRPVADAQEPIAQRIDMEPSLWPRRRSRAPARQGK